MLVFKLIILAIDFGVHVTRQLLSNLLIFSSLLLPACGMQHDSYHLDYPNLPAARFNAEQGMRYLHNGQTNLAAEKFNLAKDQAPRDPLVMDALAFYYEKSGDKELANQTYFNALLLDPHSGTLRNNYGAFLCRNGYSAASIDYFMKAARVPNYRDADGAYANARYCVEKLGAGDEYAYYTKLLWQPNQQQARK
jgi:type IV pilus assembly protein PilF